MILATKDIATLRGGVEFSKDQSNTYTAEAVENLLDTIEARDSLIGRLSLALAGWNYEFGLDGTIGRDEAVALIAEADAALGKTR